MSSALPSLRVRDKQHLSSKPVISFEEVSVAYRSNDRGAEDHALSGIGFEIQPGEQIAVVGPNGAGKSTLMKCIAGLLSPDQGSIEIYGSGPHGHICIGYVPQRSQLDFSFPVTVEEVVMMGRVGQIGLFRWPKRRDWSIVQECLARVSAQDLAQKQIGELSGGQQQRVFIARALAQESEILLLDEPLAGIDAPSRDLIFEILDNLSDENVTILLATHDLEVAADKFDRVMLLNQRIVAFDIPPTTLTPANLMSAYSGHLHKIAGDDGPVVLTEECHDDTETEDFAASLKTPLSKLEMGDDG